MYWILYSYIISHNHNEFYNAKFIEDYPVQLHENPNGLYQLDFPTELRIAKINFTSRIISPSFLFIHKLPIFLKIRLGNMGIIDKYDSTDCIYKPNIIKNVIKEMLNADTSDKIRAIYNNYGVTFTEEEFNMLLNIDDWNNIQSYQKIFINTFFEKTKHFFTKKLILDINKIPFSELYIVLYIFTKNYNLLKIKIRLNEVSRSYNDAQLILGTIIFMVICCKLFQLIKIIINTLIFATKKLLNKRNPTFFYYDNVEWLYTNKNEILNECEKENCDLLEGHRLYNFIK